MKIVYADQTSELCGPSEQRQISVAKVEIAPVTPSRRLVKVQDKPPIYTKLAVVRCELIQPGHYVMTANGLKLVQDVER
jgi:hypothetical protein